MPDFPRHDSKEALTTSQPRAFRDDADIRTDAVDRSKQDAKFIKDVTDTTMKWNAAVEKIQQDTALYNYKTGMQDISARAATDTDINAETKYQKEAEDLRKNVTQGMNPALANSMSPELNYMASVSSAGIQGEFRKKNILHGQAIAEGNVAMVVDNPTGDPMRDLTRIQSIVDEAVEDGLFNEVEGGKLKRRNEKQLKENTFIQRMSEDLGRAEKDLQKNAFGMDVEQLNNSWKVFEQQSKVIRNQNEEMMIDKIRDIPDTDVKAKEEAIDEIKELRSKKMIDANYATQAIGRLKVVSYPQVDNATMIEQSNILTKKWQVLHRKEKGWGQADFVMRAQFRADAFKARRLGHINQATFNDYFGGDASRDVLPLSKDTEFLNAMDNIFQRAPELYPTPDEQNMAIYSMTKELTNRVVSGVAPRAALTEVIAEQIESDYPGYAAEDLLKTHRESGVPIFTIWDDMKKMNYKGE